MEKRLKKSDLLYLHILYVIWELVTYYSKTFKVIPEDSAANTLAEIREQNGMTFIHLQFPKVLNTTRGYTVLQMLDIYNEFLRAILLPNQTLIKPYRADNSNYGIMEALYIDMVYEDETYLHLDVIYVDNPTAYKYVRADEKLYL